MPRAPHPDMNAAGNRFQYKVEGYKTHVTSSFSFWRTRSLCGENFSWGIMHTKTHEHAHRKHPQKHTYRETHTVCRKSNLSPETKLDKKVGTYFLKVGKQSLIQNIRLFTCKPHWNTWSKLPTFSSAG